MSLEVLSCSSEDEFRDKLLDVIQKYGVNLSKKIVDLEELHKTQKSRPRISIVIDGPSLAFAFNDEHCANALF